MKKTRWNDDLLNWVKEYFYNKDEVNNIVDEISEVGTRVDDELDPNSRLPVQNKVITNALLDKAEGNHVHSYGDILDKPTIPTVVDTVSDGNPNPISSNGVYDYMIEHHHGVIMVEFTEVTIYELDNSVNTVNFLTDNSSSFSDLNYEDLTIDYLDGTSETVRFYVA